ncbi:MAG: metallophosphatase family protein [Desulfoarculaceae bacterium]|nr:metallophosphatase family protein [Desulfoarculaceae bacterium]
MIHVGILSDTHLTNCPDSFRRQVDTVFAECPIIIHAGDLTDISILAAFSGKEVHAVHGNMCNIGSQQQLPVSKLISIGGFQIGLCHGAWGPRHTIEERVWALFPEADCIVYGHSHKPVCHRIGNVLFINPGTFQGTGPHGAPGTYAILQIDEQADDRRKGLEAAIHELPQLS